MKTNWEELEASVWAKKFYRTTRTTWSIIPATNFIDPALFLDFHYTTDESEWPGYAQPEFDALIEKGRRAARSQERARQVYQQIGDQLNEDQPWIWLWSLAGHVRLQPPREHPVHDRAAGRNPKTIADVPLTPTVQALPTWFYRLEEWTVKA